MPQPRLNYQDFKEEFLRRLNQCFPELTIRLGQAAKNNDNHADVLEVEIPDCSEYIQQFALVPFWDLYQEGALFTTLCGRFEEGLKEWEELCPRQGIGAQLTDEEHVRQSLVPRLCSVRRNRDLLETIPYVPFLDLAVTFRVLLTGSDTQYVLSATVDHEAADRWHLSPEELYSLALANSRRMYRPTLWRWLAPTGWTVGSDMVLPRGNVSGRSCALTLEHGPFGASVLLWDGVLQGIADRSHTNFYVLPSSTEEVLLAPAEKNDRMEHYSQLVREENRRPEVVEPRFVLEDHAYYFDRRRGTLVY